MTEVRIETVYLRNVAARMDDIRSDLRLHTHLAERSLPCSPEVGSAFDHLSGRWDKHRDTLSDLLAELADGFRVAADGFEMTDEELAARLSGSSGA